MKWQYKWVELNPVSDGLQGLNALGAQEWEVIAMDADYLLMKRPVPKSEPWLGPIV